MANGNGFWKKAGVILTVLVLGVSIVVGYVKSSEEIKDNCTQITDHEDRVRKVENAIIEQRVDIKHIKECMKRQEKISQERHTEQKSILKEIRDDIKNGH